jgi:hypothetical protein
VLEADTSRWDRDATLLTASLLDQRTTRLLGEPKDARLSAPRLTAWSLPGALVLESDRPVIDLCSKTRRPSGSRTTASRCPPRPVRLRATGVAPILRARSLQGRTRSPSIPPPTTTRQKTDMATQQLNSPVAPEDRVPLGRRSPTGPAPSSTCSATGSTRPGVAGLQIYLGCGPGLVSTALMVNRLLDAVSDPVFGWLSDNTRSRWAGRRPFVLVGAVLSGLTLPLLFVVGRGWTPLSYFWFMVMLVGIYITIVSSFAVAYSSLATSSRPDYQERRASSPSRAASRRSPRSARPSSLDVRDLQPVSTGADGNRTSSSARRSTP